MVSLSLKYHCNINHQYRGNFQWGNKHYYKPPAGIQLAHFGLESGMVFEGTMGCMNAFIVSIPDE